MAIRFNNFAARKAYLRTLDPEGDPRPPRFLVLRYSSLGDVALTNPLLDQLEQAYPASKVYFATKAAYAPAIRNHPVVEKVVALEGGGWFSFLSHLGELKALQPDVVLDLHDNLRSRLACWSLKKAKVYRYDKEAIHRRLLVKKLTQTPSTHVIEKYLKVLKKLDIYPSGQIPFHIPVTGGDRNWMKDYMEKNKITASQLVVGMGPGALWNTKRWFPERYAELASRLVERYQCKLLWFGSPEEAGLIREIQDQMTCLPSQRGLALAGKLDLSQSIALLGRCDIFVANDSGLMHLAVGSGCRVVSIFGSTTPALGFAPWGPTNTIVENAGLPCRPCHVHGRRFCPKGHFKCMEEITVDLVEGAVQRAVKRSR